MMPMREGRMKKKILFRLLPMLIFIFCNIIFFSFPLFPNMQGTKQAIILLLLLLVYRIEYREREREKIINVFRLHFYLFRRQWWRQRLWHCIFSVFLAVFVFVVVVWTTLFVVDDVDMAAYCCHWHRNRYFFPHPSREKNSSFSLVFFLVIVSYHCLINQYNVPLKKIWTNKSN